MNKAPCKDCEYRHLHCHADCDKYAAYVNERREYLAKRKENAVILEYIKERKNMRKSR